MALTDNLISYWKLDEASGNALDAHGSNDLTDNNTVGAATGKISGARDFEAGNSEYFSHADNTDLSTGDISFSISCWVQLESKSASMYIANKTGDEWGLVYEIAEDRFRFWVQEGSGGAYKNVYANNLGSPSTGTWYHIVGWYDSSADTINIVVNNGTADTTSSVTGPADRASIFTLGVYGGSLVQYWDGLLDESGFWKRVLTSDERTALYNSGNGLAYPFVTSYTLTADSGSFALTGQAATLRAARKLSPDSGSYALTGQDAGLRAGRRVGADAGGYSLSGQEINLRALRTLTSDSGSYALTGQDASLRAGRILASAPGAYSLAGTAAALRAARTLPGGPGSYALSGTAASLRAVRALAAAGGSYSLAGQDASLLAARVLAASSGSYALTGQDATLTPGSPAPGGGLSRLPRPEPNPIYSHWYRGGYP